MTRKKKHPNKNDIVYIIEDNQIHKCLFSHIEEDVRASNIGYVDIAYYLLGVDIEYSLYLPETVYTNLADVKEAFKVEIQIQIDKLNTVLSEVLNNEN